MTINQSFPNIQHFRRYDPFYYCRFFCYPASIFRWLIKAMQYISQIFETVPTRLQLCDYLQRQQLIKWKFQLSAPTTDPMLTKYRSLLRHTSCLWVSCSIVPPNMDINSTLSRAHKIPVQLRSKTTLSFLLIALKGRIVLTLRPISCVV